MRKDQRSDKVTAVGEDQILNEGTVISCSTTSFRVKACIGQGCFGRVVYCIEVTTNTPVATKTSMS